MSRRYSMTAEVETIRLLFAVEWSRPWAPRYKIEPTQMAPVVRLLDGTRELSMLVWGLIPSWAANRSAARTRINAPAETLSELPSFRGAFNTRRCLVMASGFYQWPRGDKSKRPYWIGFKDRRPFGLAGVWENWMDPTSGERVESFAIITTAANSLVAPIHHRMPAIIDAAHFDLWLGAPAAPNELMRPYPAHSMDARLVETGVGNATLGDPRCIEPLDTSAANAARDQCSTNEGAIDNARQRTSRRSARETKLQFKVIRLDNRKPEERFAVKASGRGGPPVVIGGFRTERDACAWIYGAARRAQ
jgi:putative SOS response-associated peptidase YedK